MEKDKYLMVSEGTRALARVSQHIGLVDKVLDEARKEFLKENDSVGLILIDSELHQKKSDVEKAIIQFILTNFWYYLNFLKRGILNNEFENRLVESRFLEEIVKNDKNYEFPRAFYKNRGQGGKEVPKSYDNEIKGKNETYILCCPLIEKDFNEHLINNLNNRIIGAVFSYFDQTSVGFVLGIKVRYKN